MSSCVVGLEFYFLIGEKFGVHLEGIKVKQMVLMVQEPDIRSKLSALRDYQMNH